MNGGTLPCPHCRTALHEVTARARTGYLIVLDQCSACGGIWCDRWEVFPLAAAEARRLDPVDAGRLGADVDEPREVGRCPRCEIGLTLFHDPLLPPDARIERCRVCEGMWLNRGELRRLKSKTPDAHVAAPEAVERLAKKLGKETTWSRVENIDAALRSFEEPPPDPAATRSAIWSTAGWIALQALLRLLFRV
jgi:Zn-finger nucleic acid-binding protein